MLFVYTWQYPEVSNSKGLELGVYMSFFRLKPRGRDSGSGPEIPFWAGEASHGKVTGKVC